MARKKVPTPPPRIVNVHPENVTDAERAAIVRDVRAIFMEHHLKVLQAERKAKEKEEPVWSSTVPSIKRKKRLTMLSTTPSTEKKSTGENVNTVNN